MSVHNYALYILVWNHTLVFRAYPHLCNWEILLEKLGFDTGSTASRTNSLTPVLFLALDSMYLHSMHH